jgi:hypothetical protein
MSSPSAPWKQIINAGVAFAIWSTGAGLAAAQNVSYNNGPVLLNPINVHLIYWFPPGVEAYPGAVSGLGDFDGIITSFLANISGSAYLNIATQYTMACDSGTCALKNSPGAVNVVAHITDTRAYPPMLARKPIRCRILIFRPRLGTLSLTTIGPSIQTMPSL